MSGRRWFDSICLYGSFVQWQDARLSSGKPGFDSPRSRPPSPPLDGRFGGLARKLRP